MHTAVYASLNLSCEQFCEKGHVKLGVDFVHGDEKDQLMFFFTVTNTGPGMNKEQVTQALHKYWQHVDFSW